MSLAQEANRYLEETSPWKTIKNDREATAIALYVSLSVLSCLKTILYPFLPFSSQKLHTLLGFEGNVDDNGWTFSSPKPGQKLASPAPLFNKLEERVITEESGRLGKSNDQSSIPD